MSKCSLNDLIQISDLFYIVIHRNLKGNYNKPPIVPPSEVAVMDRNLKGNNNQLIITVMMKLAVMDRNLKGNNNIMQLAY